MDTLLIALILGGLFGFVLDRIGATNPQKIIQMLNLTDMHLAKTILLGIGISSTLMFAGQMIGVVDPGHMSVKAAHLGVLLGGIILGIGWALSGFCPGTGVAAAGTGRIDALFFVAGGLAGAFAYMLSYDWIKSTGVLQVFHIGKVTLGSVTGSKYQGVIPLPGEILGIGVGILLIVLACVLPHRLAGKPH